MYEVLTSPPMPAWDDLRNEDREAIMKAWDYCGCSHGCGEPGMFYRAIRDALIAREKFYLKYTMTEPV